MSTERRSLSVSTTHACLVDSDQSLSCWGNNYANQIAASSTDENYAPNGLSSVSAFSTAPTVSLNSYVPDVSELGFSDFVLGTYHACGIYSGKLKCWGTNSSGQVGNGSTSPYSFSTTSPYTVFSSGVSMVALGNYHTCAIVSGTLKCWGANTYGQIGNGTSSGSPVVVAYTVPIASVTSVYAAADDTCAITATGALYCWGYNLQGQVGSGTTSAGVTSPTLIIGSGVASLSMSSETVCALMVSGELKCWGNSYYGQVGSGVDGAIVSSPTTVIANGVYAVSNSRTHACAIVGASKAVYCWGSNAYGQLGFGFSGSYYTLPTASFATGVEQIRLVSETTCTLNAAGAVHCWGQNFSGQVGFNTGSEYAILNPYTVYSSGVSRFASSNSTSAVCILAGMSPYCWGTNSYGLYNGSTTSSTPPIQITAGTTVPLVFGSGAANSGDLLYNNLAVSDTTCVVGQDSSLKCWGANTYGQTGKTSVSSYEASPITALSSGVSGVAVSTHTCAVQNGALKCWGANSSGQVGNSVPSSQVLSPFTVFTSGVRAVGVGTSHTCALVRDSLYCWGAGGFGQLGNNSASNVNAAPALVIASGVTDLSVRGNSTCAVVLGELKCWGLNSQYQLGISNGGASVYVPTTVIASNVSSVSLGLTHGCAVVAAVPYCWGQNTYGQIGLGTSGGGVTTPTSISLSGVTQISAGQSHTCAITNGDVYCWGYSGQGQIGDGSTTNHLTPVFIRSSVGTVGAGYSHTCAVLYDGSVQCWGGNSYAQLGKGSAGPVYPASSYVAGDFRQMFPSGVRSVSVGEGFTCAVMLDTSLQCWGTNYNAQLGAGDLTDRDLNHPFILFSSGVTAVATHSFSGGGGCAIVSGALYCWGDNSFSQAGDDPNVNYTVMSPFLVEASGVEKFFVTGISTCYLKSDHSMWCIGYNNSGIFNDGGATPQTNVPIPISLPTGVGDLIDIAGSAYTTCGIFDDSSTRRLYCWGGNQSGQIYTDVTPGTETANGAGTEYNPPVLVRQSTGLEAVYAGDVSIFTVGRICFVDSGELICRGDNSYSTIDVNSSGIPVDYDFTVHASSVSLVASGSPYMACAIVSDDISCWGSNQNNLFPTNLVPLGAESGPVNIQTSVGP